MTNIDEARIAFEVFKTNVGKYVDHDLNESDTRSKVIDEMLFKVLGWKEEEIYREGHSDAGFYDYKVSIPGLSFIIEAKRQYNNLSIPANHKKASIKSLYNENREIIDQIRSYCMETGIQYGIITNGRQFIFLKLINVDSKNWKDNQCILFSNLIEVEERFIQFYENLSKFGIVNNGGFKYDLPNNTTESKTILSSILNRDKELVRNSLSAKIAPVITRIFGEIFSEEQEDDMEFIEKCFVGNEETLKNKDEIERLFADRAPEISSVIPAVNSISIRNQITEEINQDSITIKNLIPPNPIIIIGSKGAGKTTFINHLFKYSLGDEDMKNHLSIYLDLRKFFNKHEFFEPTKVAHEILELLYDKYPMLELHSGKVLERIYIKQIKRNDESVWKYDKEKNEVGYNEKLMSFFSKAQEDSIVHLEHLNKYIIRERRKRLIVIIDNADQFDSTIQSEVFIFAHSLSKAALCGTVISLREGYYYKWRLSPPFDAYESNVYHITAPKYSEVLQRRIDYTLEKINLEQDTIHDTGLGSTLQITNQSLIEFLSGLRNSLFSKHNSDLLDFLNYTTYPNIREGLRTFKQFLISGHTNVIDYIQRERFRTAIQNPQIIPIHEFIKSIGLQNKHYYNSELSTIHNLFIPPIDTDDHFIKLYILEELFTVLINKGSAGKFISSKNVIEKFNSFGYRINAINSSLHSLLKLGLLDTEEQLTDIEWQTLPTEITLCITSKGHYYYNQLINRFYYLDLVLQDTPIFENTSFEGIKSGFPTSNDEGKRLLYDRIGVVKKFLKYLKLMESRQPRQLISTYGSLVDYISKGFDEDIAKMPDDTGAPLFTKSK